MIEAAVRISGEPIEEGLRAELARNAAVAGTVKPILRHLLGTESSSLFGDEIVACVRGMQAHLARQLLATAREHRESGAEQEIALSEALLQDSQMLGHLHALAIEWQLTQRLEQHFAIDPVVPPLLQALIASPEAETQDLAMKLLAAQARWCQGQRRMQLTPAELPGELFHAALLALRSIIGDAANFGEAQLRAGYDEGTTRLGLAARLVTSMGSAAAVALDIRHGGSALFVTTLALGSGQSRDAAILATHQAQATRLALGLRAAGLSTSAVEQQLVLLHGEARLPAGFERLGIERAAAILSDAHDGGH
jgi:hypothetical protein